MNPALVVQEKNSNIVMANFSDSLKRVDVAVGIIINSSFEVLMAQRALSLHQGGLWEFPGGKIEPDETIEDALKRELREEISINIYSFEPLISMEHHYPDKHVCLHTYKITAYSGEPKICDGQLDLKWISLKSWNIKNYPLPAANIKIMQTLINSLE